MNNSTHVQLSGLAPALADLTGVTPPSYRKLLDHARDGLIRTEVSNGRHFVPRSECPSEKSLTDCRVFGSLA